MKLRFLILIVLVGMMGRTALPHEPEKSQTMTRDQVSQWLAGGGLGERAAALVKPHGIDFLPDEEYLHTSRQARADDTLIAALGGASHAAMGELVVTTSPHAEIYLDGELQGRANAQGELSMKARLGVHALKVTLAGKKDFARSVTLSSGQAAKIEVKLVDAPGSIRLRTLVGASISLDGAAGESADLNGELVIGYVSPGAHQLRISMPGKKEYQQSLTVEAGQEIRIEAKLEDAPGTIRVLTLAGASVTLDGASRGSTAAKGEIVLGEVSPGAHQLQLSAPGKKEYQQSVTVEPGEEARVEATLQDASPPPGQVRENPKDGLKYVWIPPGTFMMGCSPGDNECYDEEKPSHRVTLTKGFWIGQTEVTVAAYKRFAGTTGRQLPSLKPAWARDTLPIVNMKWTDAQAYCQWAGGRLLTEAEWEYAARGGSTEARYGPIDEVAWYGKNSGGQPHEVAQKRANGFGLFDMLGNEWEWVSDWFDPNYYQNSPSQDPPGPASGKDRVTRGGSWDIIPRVVRVSIRSSTNPDAPRSAGNSGFRCGGEVFAP
jgi:formylglycine-generating enzyme required for sulfatase activity